MIAIKNIKKIIQIGGIIAVTTLIAGCGGGGNAGAGKMYTGGTEALSMEFVAGAPPTSIYDRGQFPFDITLLVKNMGEDDLARTDVKYIKITGIDPAEFNNFPNTKNTLTEDLPGKKIDADGNIVNGGLVYESFTDTTKAKYTPRVSGSTLFNIRADMCYEYTTYAEGAICVRDNPLSTADSPVCKVDETKTLAVSSAPVQITQLTESPAGSDMVSFTFKLVKSGTTEIFDRTSTSKCDLNDLASKNKVHVKVELVEPGNLVLSCGGLTNNEGEVMLYEGERLVRCNVNTEGARSDFTKQVKISATYLNLQNIQTSMQVKASTGN